jgi:two-component system CheB/CheR fusion protein
LAIVLAEQLVATQTARRTKIFATDIDPQAVAIARMGTYPENIDRDVSSDRLHRFFGHRDNNYIVSMSLRESLVFAVQDLRRDPPFSKVDLISCRNVLKVSNPRPRNGS